MKEYGSLKARYSYVKPMLTADNVQVRLDFAKTFLRPSSNATTPFPNMHDIVHVDEKWFYLTRVKRKFYVYDDEEVAARSVKSKNFITKAMFLAAFARPRYDPATKEDFDGKIGIWPFVEIIAAKSKSINREKVTPVTVPQNVNGGVYKDFKLQKVVPAVLARFPVGDLRRGVRIQQDNASPHRQVTITFLQNAGIQNVGIMNQPPNSPDFNVLDLGFFNSI
ncbi:hypothetical protein AaE_003582 [Aphanomyces astaci]|uniref:Tc1-like transposase DDE domain-containing protein n=1 Tax=Aphanomyces astaci TaxID=112090 RepID=A0A6A5A6V3_APHAT|nr:hypothetical protein AaE_003582 [Aphanomyces astaci]